MAKKYFYFQPQYVGKFKCDGSKCDAHCCQTGWNILIDSETYNKYKQLDSPEIISHIKFHDDRKEYFIAFDRKKYCPFLNENKLCSLQLKYGEKFLSRTCATYPRITNNFEYFFERALILSCPVAAEMILFERKPMQFEFVELPEEIHSLNGKLFFQVIQSTEELRRHLIEIQAAMISILQERTLSIDQRLIVLCFFVDKLGEIFSNFDENALTKLIAAYESKNFLTEQVPLMIQTITFNAEKFIQLMRKLLDSVYDGEDAFDTARDKKFLGAFVDIFKLNPAEKNAVPVSTVVKNYYSLVEERKKFLADYATFLENYLVNELFLSIYPWRFEGSPLQNFAAFVTEYKLFELITFSASFKNLDDKKTLLEMTSWFTTRFDHVNEYKQRIFSFIANRNEPFSLMESLLEGSN